MKKITLIDDITDDIYNVPLKEVVLVGRQKENDVVIPDRGKISGEEGKRFGVISRFHCEIHNDEKGIYVMDCQTKPSVNGTRVDENRVSGSKCLNLEDGSLLDLGGVLFEVKIEENGSVE